MNSREIIKRLERTVGNSSTSRVAITSLSIHRKQDASPFPIRKESYLTEHSRAFSAKLVGSGRRRSRCDIQSFFIKTRILTMG